GGFCACMAVRAQQRKDVPPPGFVLVGLALVCVAAGSVLSIAQHYRDLDPYWILLQHLLSYQGFVLLPILGIGPFLLPRFFGMPTPDQFPESRVPNAAWLRKAGLAFAAGLLIIGSFFVEASGSYRAAYAVRFLVTLGYFLLEMPFA